MASRPLAVRELLGDTEPPLWYASPSCADGEEWDFHTAITSDTRIYAKWLEDDSYVTAVSSAHATEVREVPGLTVIPVVCPSIVTLYQDVIISLRLEYLGSQ